ncbi:MAG: hypothetical protein ACPG8V_01815 [Alphaproteobacteria bacterium]
MIFKRLLLILSLLSFNTFAFALDKDLGVSKKFYAHMYKDESGNKICNAYAFPSAQSSPSRGKVVKLHITNRPHKRHKHKVSINMGTIITGTKEITLNIDGKKYKMFAHKNFVFPYNKDDKSIVKRMKRGRTLKVKIKTNSGKTLEDVYSLQGVVKILSKIDKACR